MKTSRLLIPALVAALAAAALLFSCAPAHAATLPCSFSSWAWGCGGSSATGQDPVSLQPQQPWSFWDGTVHGNASVSVAFASDGRSATFIGSKALSNYTVAFCDGSVINVPGVLGLFTHFTFSFDKCIQSIRLQAGSTNCTWLNPGAPGVGGSGSGSGSGSTGTGTGSTGSGSTGSGTGSSAPKKTTLNLAETTSKSAAKPGAAVTITLAVKNTGSHAAHAAQVCTTPDVNWAFASASKTPTSRLGQELCFALTSIKAAHTKSINVKLTLTDAASGAATDASAATATNAPAVNASASVTVRQSKTSTGPATYLTGAATGGDPDGDFVPVEKVQQFVGLAAGQTQTVTLSCPTGQLMTDASAEVQHVDQGTGTLASVNVSTSQTATSGSYLFVLDNTAAGQAQVMLFGSCLVGQTVNHHNALNATAALQDTKTLPAGRGSVKLTCQPGQTPVAPGYAIISGAGTLQASEPTEHGRGWTLTFSLGTASTVTASVRCLNRQTGAAAGKVYDLALSHQVQTVTVPAGQDDSYQVICDQQAKGLVASMTLPSGLLSMGSEPDPKTRVFWLENTTAAPLTATIDLVCIGDRTSAPSTPAS